jgi:uncharacterized membrane protein YcaP (DUF421 family)
MELLRGLIGPDNGETSTAQLCVRGVIVLVLGIAYIRIAGRRTFSQGSPLDIVVAVIVGSNLSRAMTGRAPFWEGLAATLLLVVLHRVLAMATVRWTWLADFVKGKPAVLVRDGALQRKTMWRHAVSEADLMEGLRQEQADDPKKVRQATLENSGRISVVPKAAK